MLRTTAVGIAVLVIALLVAAGCLWLWALQLVAEAIGKQLRRRGKAGNNPGYWVGTGQGVDQAGRGASVESCRRGEPTPRGINFCVGIY